MKHWGLHLVRAYLSVGFFFYYKRIYVKGLENSPKTSPVIFLGNHQNALIDALLIAVKSKRFSYFLTRASVFKNPIVASLLKGLRMIPVYRVRDGFSTVKNNKTVFKHCSKLLHQNQAIALFPEGNHHINRTVRPLSKGFTRIIAETLKQYPQTELKLIPVGFNYRNATTYPDSVLLNFGMPIAIHSQKTNSLNKMPLVVKNQVFEALCELTTHIPNAQYKQTLSWLESMEVDFLNPTAVNHCVTHKTKVSAPSKKRKTIWGSAFKNLLKLGLFGPYIIWKIFIKPRIKEVEFIDTFRYIIAITLVPLFMFLMAVLLYLFFGLLIGGGYVFITLTIALLAVKL